MGSQLVKLNILKHEDIYLAQNPLKCNDKSFYNSLHIVLDNSNTIFSYKHNELFNALNTLITMMYNTSKFETIYIYTNYPTFKKYEININDMYTELFKIPKISKSKNDIKSFSNLIKKCTECYEKKNYQQWLIIYGNLNNSLSNHYLNKNLVNDLDSFSTLLIKHYSSAYFVNLNNDQNNIVYNFIQNLNPNHINSLNYTNIFSIYNDYLKNAKNEKYFNCGKIFFNDINELLMESNKYSINIIELNDNEFTNNFQTIIDIFEENIILELTNLTYTSSQITKLINLFKLLDKKENCQKSNHRMKVLSWALKKIQFLAYNKNDNITENFFDLIGKYSTDNISKKLDNTLFKYKNKIDKKIVNRVTKNLEKINKNKMNSSSRILVENLNKIKNMEENNTMDKSLDFFLSSVTLSNWLDEINNESSIGLLININTNNQIKIGYSNSEVLSIDISNEFLSTKDYIHTICDFFKKDNEHGNINDKSIINNNEHKYNSIIPLYINKVHWNISKYQLPYILGTILTHNPLGFIDSHYNFMYYFLLENLVKLNNNIISDKTIQIFFSVWRTCMQISYENGFHKGVLNLTKNIIKNNNLNQIERSFLFDYHSILGQLLCTKIDNNPNQVANYINFICNKLSIDHKLNTQDINNLVFLPLSITNYQESQESIKNNPDMLHFLNNLKNEVKVEINKIYFFCNMWNYMNNILFKKITLKKFLEQIENNYGLVNNDIIDDFKNYMKSRLNLFIKN